MIRIYNTLTRRKEVFRPRQGNKVRMFVCGPTVYDLSHIGHARTYLVFDLIARYLRFRGFRVSYLQNITDIDDKIILRAKQRGVAPEKLAREMERRYLADMRTLGVTSVSRYARATDFINEIVKQVRLLERKGLAYRIEGDGYYFDLKKFPHYGALSRRTTTAAEDAVSRIDESVKKHNRGDFCLWKFSKSNEPSWKTRLGVGRPGWHIEDTAMTHKIFGPQYDLHGGALDLIFPHHEAEIAQMEAAYGKHPFVKYWIHSGFLNVRGEKMSKSLRNFVTIRELLGTWPAEVFRLFVFSTHYRTPIDYDADLMSQAAASLERIRQFALRLKNPKLETLNPKQTQNSKPPPPPRLRRASKIRNTLAQTRKKFFAALDDDFDTPRALAALFHLIRRINPSLETGTLIARDCEQIATFLDEVDAILGILPKAASRSSVPREVQALLKRREALRKEKKFAEADAVRNELSRRGWQIEDTMQGPRVKKAR